MSTAISSSLKVTISLIAVILAIIAALTVLDILAPAQALNIAWKAAAVIAVFALAFIIIQLMSADSDADR